MLQALNILTMYTADHTASAEFYMQLGFEPVAADDTVAVVRLGDFCLQFVPISGAENKDSIFYEEAHTEPKGAGLYTYIQVKDIDAYYQRLLSLGIRTSSEPSNWPWGNREFVLRDPDGYKLCFYEPLGD